MLLLCRGDKLRKQTITAFFIFTVSGGFSLLICRVLSNYILSLHFNNYRFWGEVINNFATFLSVLLFIIGNLGCACLVSIIPCIYLNQVKRLSIAFVLPYFCVIFLIYSLSVAFYLNLAGVTLPIISMFLYVVILPFICTAFPIWFAYSVYRIYRLAKASAEF